MKIAVAASILLLFSSCGRDFTGAGSIDLRVSTITFSDSDPATITGTLPFGKPADFLVAINSPEIQSVTLRYSQNADTSGLASANDVVCFPLTVSSTTHDPADGVAEVQVSHSGLHWFPRYRMVERGSLTNIYATVLLENSTGQTWTADTLKLTDSGGNLVTTATGSVSVRPGINAIPWWSTPGGMPEAVIVYGWPIPGRWNPLIAVSCPGAGRVESRPEGIRMKNDTLWFPADSLLELDLTWEQRPDGYSCFLEAASTTDSTVRWRVLWPSRLPRGAQIDPGREAFSLSGGETVTIRYTESY